MTSAAVGSKVVALLLLGHWVIVYCCLIVCGVFEFGFRFIMQYLVYICLQSLILLRPSELVVFV